jgi:hypothetical protein
MTRPTPTEEDFNAFLKMAFQQPKNPRLMVYCEHCDDLTIVEKGGVTACGHRPKWLDELEAWIGE